MNGMRKMVYWMSCVLAFCLIFITSLTLKGSAVANPPAYARQYVLAATVASAYVPLVVSSGTVPAQGVTASVLICNDDPVGGDDIWVNFTDTTAADPATSAWSNNLTVKAGERINYDGRFRGVAIRTSANTATVRIQATY